MQQTNAIVLRIVRYADNRAMVAFFTEHYGIISASVNISRRRKSETTSALFQPLSLVEMWVDYKPASSIQKIKDISISSPLLDIHYNPIKASLCMFLSDFLYHCLKGEPENRELFDFVLYSIKWLDASETNVANYHVIFLLRMTRFLGIFPGMDGYSKCKVYDLQNACYCSSLPSHGQYIEAKDARWIPVFLHMDYSQMNRIRLSREKRWHMLEVLLDYYRLHIPAFAELQSLVVLRELFS